MKVLTTHLRIHRLRFYAYHGVLPQEHVVGGEYEVNVDLLLTPPSEAFENDCIEGTVDYAAVCDELKSVMEHPSALLERVAWQMAQRLLQNFAMIAQVTLSVRKLCPPMDADCDGAEIEITAVRGDGA